MASRVTCLIWHSSGFHCRHCIRDHSMYGCSQWETMLRCNTSLIGWAHVYTKCYLRIVNILSQGWHAGDTLPSYLQVVVVVVVDMLVVGVGVGRGEPGWMPNCCCWYPSLWQSRCIQSTGNTFDIIVIETVVTGNYTKLTRYTCCHMVSLGLPLRDNLMVWRLLSRCILPHIAPFPTFGNRCLSTIGSGKQWPLSVGAAPGPQGMAGAILCAQKIPELPMISSIDDAENLWHEVITWTNVDL